MEPKEGGPILQGVQYLLPNLGLLHVNGAKHQDERLPIPSRHLRLGKPLFLHPLECFRQMRGDLIFGEFFPFQHQIHRSVLETGGKLQAELPARGKHRPRGLVDLRIVRLGHDSVPVDDHPVDSGQLHLEKLAFQKVGVGRIIRADQGMVVGPDVRQAVFLLLVRIVLFFVSRPMTPPLAPSLRRFIPRHVMHQQGLSLPHSARSQSGLRGHRCRRFFLGRLDFGCLRRNDGRRLGRAGRQGQQHQGDNPRHTPFQTAHFVFWRGGFQAIPPQTLRHFGGMGFDLALQSGI